MAGGVAGGVAGGEPGWRRLVLRDGRLWYRPPSRWWWRPSLRFEPGGLDVVPRDGGDAWRLPWDGGVPAHSDSADWAAPVPPDWCLAGVRPSRTNRPGIAVVPYSDRGRAALGGRRRVWLPTWWVPPIEELPALARFLTSYPAARTGLGDPARVERLLRGLAGSEWRRPRPPGEPLMGDRYDLHHAILRVSRRQRWPIVARHPVRMPGLPSLAEATSAVMSEVPARSPYRRDRDGVQAVVRRHLEAGAWPFGHLLPGADPVDP